MSDLKQTTVMEAAQDNGRPHQPGEDVFTAVLPEDVNRQSFAAFPPSVLLATIVGYPSQPGPYTIRVRVPHGVKLMPPAPGRSRVHRYIRRFLPRPGRSV